MILNQIIGSKGRVALLNALFDGKCKHIHIRELARNTGLSAPSLMREAKTWVKLGLLLESRDGNRVDYWANFESPLYEPLRMLVEKTSGAVAVLRDAFSDCDASVVFIYGSRAKGTERSDSDYDVFVIGNEGLRQISARVRAVADRTDAEINPYVLSTAEFVKRRAAGDHFLSDVLASGKIFLKGGEDELAGLA